MAWQTGIRYNNYTAEDIQWLIANNKGIMFENQWWEGITGASEASGCYLVREWVAHIRMVGSSISLLSPFGLNLVKIPSL